ncbi:MAG: 23S rRNA (uracil(1939)-C(5))-methyltransferase RlmD [Lachnospiraceae bacterium]|jgi:23S rRNA (uracil1939-C5)-methyltransferase|nr:23S rRNA (uracil(1939)-C(5))-methyltransferase RlmD [Lachnospiraceae bacterium]
MAAEKKKAGKKEFSKDKSLTGERSCGREGKVAEGKAVREGKPAKEGKAVRERKLVREVKSARGGKSHENKRGKSLCPATGICGGCQYLDMPYEEQLKKKQQQIQNLLGKFCKVYPITGMDNPFHYRNKVHAVFGYQKGEVVSGVYQEGTHHLVPVEHCMIEDKKADEIIKTIRGMLKSFKIRTYDEDTEYGLLRHVLIRRGFATGEIMVVLVTASPVFPSKNNFSKALLKAHPDITTIVQNINERGTSMVLGEKEYVLYGPGYIEDVLCGYRFRISSRSFYQINPVQTEKLYAKAVELAGLTKKEVVLDAYCGIGTIGIIASSQAKQVIGVELNKDAIRDAIQNAKYNQISNVWFYCNDAPRFMCQMAENGEQVDVVLMDPPRSGSSEEFIRAVKAVQAKRVVYVSCGPETLARDIEVFRRMGYEAKGAWPFDMFPAVKHIECVVGLRQKI